MNDCVFSEIRDDNTAYWLGFLAADCSVSSKRNQIQIGSCYKDKKHLEQFNKFVGGNYTVLDRMVNCTTNGKSYRSCFININSYAVKQDLISKYGIVPNKSHCDIPFIDYIPEQYKMPFFIGLLDGDGSIIIDKHEKFSIYLCGNKQSMTSTLDFLMQYFNWTESTQILQDKRSITTYFFTIHKKDRVLQICNEYRRFSQNCDVLERKLQLVDKIINLYQERSTNINRKMTITHEKKEIRCKQCGKYFFPSHSNQKYCSYGCVHLSQQRCDRPNREELKNLIRNNSFLCLSQMYGVSDKAIRKWCKSVNLPYKKTEINKISDEQWEYI